MKFFILLSAAFLATANAQSFSMGHCNDEIETMRKFNKERFTGKWYEIKRVPNVLEDGNKCSAFPVQLSKNPNIVFDVSLSDLGRKRGRTWETFLYVVFNEHLSVGKLQFSPGFITNEQPWWILETDYDNYCVVYSCLDSYDGKLEFLWINSRSSTLNKTYLEKAEKVVRDRNLNLKLVDVVQDC